MGWRVEKGKVRLLFRPEEVAIAKIVDFSGEGGLIGAAGLFQNPVNGEGSTKVTATFLNAGSLCTCPGKPEILRLRNSGRLGARATIKNVEIGLEGVLLAAELLQTFAPDKAGFIAF